MVPPAPGRFSMTTGWLSLSCMAGARMRPMMSAPPPAPNATMIRIGLCGHSWADACHPAAYARNAIASYSGFRVCVLLFTLLASRHLEGNTVPIHECDKGCSRTSPPQAILAFSAAGPSYSRFMIEPPTWVGKRQPVVDLALPTSGRNAKHPLLVRLWP